MSANYITLNNGEKMPKIGLGTARAFKDDLKTAVSVSFESGYRSIDTAFLYLNEEFIGEEIQDWLSKGKLKREDIFITTKLPSIGNRASDVSHFLTTSLRRLNLDYVDLFLIHHPFGFKNQGDNNVFGKGPDGLTVLDPVTDHIAIWQEMEKEVKNGRVRSIGLSNFNKSQIERILKVAEIPPAVLQIEIHCYLPQKHLVEYCQGKGIAVTAYSPLGAPSKKSGQDVSPRLLENPVILGIGKKYNKTAGQVVLRFLLQRNIIVIPKSITPERIRSNFEITDFRLTEDEMDQLFSLDRGEKGRIFHFKDIFKGCENLKEYPFHDEY